MDKTVVIPVFQKQFMWTVDSASVQFLATVFSAFP